MAPASPGVRTRPAPQSHGPRRAAWWGLLLTVLLGHAAAMLWLRHNLVGWGEGEASMPQRIEVAFVQALAPTATAPPAAAVRPVARRARPRAAAPAASAASTPEMAELAEPAPPAPPIAPPEPAVVDAAPPEPAADIASAASAVPTETTAAAAVAPAASAPAAAPAFEWPPSTRLTYRLSGNYRGEVHGSARVQWVRQGPRYQVHLDVAIGPSFAPLISRRMTSDGELGEHGLQPQRYDEVTRLAFQATRRLTMLFAPGQVTLPSGPHAAQPGTQDPASQFVQLTWLFTTQPALLGAGNAVTLPLALPRRVSRYVYDVLGQQRLVLPFGEIDTYHLKPRLGERRPGNELSAEVWFAPTLQYLPVRIRIQQDVDTYIDLVLDAPPLQAAPEGGASAPR